MAGGCGAVRSASVDPYAVGRLEPLPTSTACGPESSEQAGQSRREHAAVLAQQQVAVGEILGLIEA